MSSPTLRIAVGPNQWTLSTNKQSATVAPCSCLSPQDQEDLRWYFEDYRRWPYDPAPEIASRVEQRIEELGEQLFQAAFPGDTWPTLWAGQEENLSVTRVEVVVSDGDGEAIPWEFMKAPGAKLPLSLAAQSFVRIADPEMEHSPNDSDPPVPTDSFRILVAICRPAGVEDVPFRSVARELLRSMDERGMEGLSVDVLRPPTFQRLGEVLRAAAQARRPYDLFHFDGHGTFAATSAAGPRRGFIVFENPNNPFNREFVDGDELGLLLAQCGVRGLILNACRSAHADVRAQPSGDETEGNEPALGSFAHQAARSGVPVVAAMRYNVHVTTAAQFVRCFYSALLQGCSAGEAVSSARRQMAANPDHQLSQPIKDWAVPVIFESHPTRLHFRSAEIAAAPRPETVTDTKDLPRFVGRDGAILNLDRGFLDSPVVLLYSLAGDGKTASALEFSAWCKQTGAVDAGRCLYTSFSQVSSVPELVQQLQDALLPANTQKDSKPVRLTRNGALRILRQEASLWIWDDLDSLRETKDSIRSSLAAFLCELSTTKARLLLLSRRPYLPWLRSVPMLHLAIAPMPLWELAELARQINAEQGYRLPPESQWMPLLRAVNGHPLALRIFACHLIERHNATAEDPDAIEEAVAAIVSGDSELPQGNALHAGLDDWFRTPESMQEMDWFALIHWFRGVVSPEDFQLIGLLQQGKEIPRVGAFAENADHLRQVFTRATDEGIFRPVAGGGFGLHPGLPSYLRSPAHHQFATALQQDAAMRAYLTAISDLSCNLTNQIIAGRSEARWLLQNNESNLIHAWGLALKHGLLSYALDMLQGLEEVLLSSGRVKEWQTMIAALAPLVSLGDQADPRWENEWNMLQEYRIRIPGDGQVAEEAEQASRQLSEYHRQQVDFANLGGELSRDQCRALRSRAVAIGEAGIVLVQHQDPACITRFDEADTIYERLGGEGIAGRIALAINRARAYAKMQSILDFDRADHFAQTAAKWAKDINSTDALVRSSLALVDVRFERLQALLENGAHESDYGAPFLALQEAMDLASLHVPAAGSKSDKGAFYELRGKFQDMQKNDAGAIADFQEAIRYVGDSSRAAVELRIRIAHALENLGRPADAKLYRDSARKLGPMLRTRKKDGA